MFDWCGSDDKVGEGRVLSNDSADFVNGIPLGPNSVKVLVETAIKEDAFLWRPASNVFTIHQAVGEIIAWPEDFVVSFDQGLDAEDIPPNVRVS